MKGREPVGSWRKIIAEVKMSPSPTTPRTSADPAPAAGDGVTLNVEQARGAQRGGVIWILAISLTLAILALGAYLLIQSPKMQAVNHPSGRDMNTQDVRKLYPQSSVPGLSSTTKPTGS